MLDIVQRLRAEAANHDHPHASRALFAEAADEIDIERLHESRLIPAIGQRSLCDMLRERATDPMWADHAEVRKDLLHYAANTVEFQRDELRALRFGRPDHA